MRLNKFIARATGKSRREADELIAQGRVTIAGQTATLGAPAGENAEIKLDNKTLTLPAQRTLIMLNKPAGYVSSRRAQAKTAKTLYELLPPELQNLKTVGRLDRDSSGLILLTDDGDLAFQLTHPKFAKIKIYLVKLDQPLAPLHQQMISDFGVALPDGQSQLALEKLSQNEISTDNAAAIGWRAGGNNPRIFWRVTMREGRNRQIRRTFAALGYTVVKLHRTDFGPYRLDDLQLGAWRAVK